MSTANHDARRRIRVFVCWLVVISLTADGLAALAFAHAWLLMGFALAVAWSPAIAAVIASLQCGKPIAEFGWRLPSLQMMAIAYAIPLGYAVAAYGFVWLTGLGRFHSMEPLAFAKLVLYSGSIVWLRGCVSSLGEEIGWRGFLLPELVKVVSFNRAAIVSGTIWAVWHFPLILFGGYHGHNQMLYSIGCFLVVIIAMSFPLSWLRLKSGEVWTCTAFHASHNLFILKLFGPLTEDAGYTR